MALLSDNPEALRAHYAEKMKAWSDLRLRAEAQWAKQFASDNMRAEGIAHPVWRQCIAAEQARREAITAAVEYMSF